MNHIPTRDTATRESNERWIADERRERAKEQNGDESFFAFATDLTRAHARELILSQPEPMFPKPEITTNNLSK